YNEQQVVVLKTTIEELKKLAPFDVVATAPSVEYDFISRYFWPASGGYEDFVTCSLHTWLAPYWAVEFCKHSLSAYQAAQRGGKVHWEVG
ncbi:phenazine biosynthesis protein PhzF, partial [Pseudoalteromonas sp. S1609]|uniref:PhzF family phenazine biosynthesis protein n=1 Tax=Pseudoalteromonas sp. S1609 TaxID=579505 RepID=UPI00110B3967